MSKRFTQTNYSKQQSSHTCDQISTLDNVPYFGIDGLSMILCLWHPPPPLIVVVSNTRPCLKLRGITLNGREEGGQYYISQTCDQERFEARKVGFSWSVSKFLQLVVAS